MSDIPKVKGGIYRVLVLPDMQVPYHDRKSLAAVEKYMADEVWHHYINLGDFLDFDCISTHNKTKLREVEGKRILKDYDAANEILDRHQSLIRANYKKARFTLLEGNHEYRVERLLQEQPTLTGMLEVDRGLRLQERGFEWVRCYATGEAYRLGKSLYHHGLYTNQNHAKSMVMAFGTNVFYGHTHDVMTHPLGQYGRDKVVVGQSMGCLCEYELAYIGQKPKNWQQAIGVIYYLPSGEFTYYVPRILHHQFVAPNGKLYKP